LKLGGGGGGGGGLSSGDLAALRRIGLVPKNSSPVASALASGASRKTTSPRGVLPSPRAASPVSSSSSAASSPYGRASSRRTSEDIGKLHITPLRHSSRAAAKGEYATLFLAETADASTLEELNTAVETVATEVLARIMERLAGRVALESALSVHLFLSSDGVPEAVLPAAASAFGLPFGLSPRPGLLPP